MCWYRDRRARASENVVLRRPRRATSLPVLLRRNPSFSLLSFLGAIPLPLAGPGPFLLGPRRRGRRGRRPGRRTRRPPRRGRRRPGLALGLARDLAAFLHRRRRPWRAGLDHAIRHRRRRALRWRRRRRRRRQRLLRLARARLLIPDQLAVNLRLPGIERRFDGAQRDRNHCFLHFIAPSPRYLPRQPLVGPLHGPAAPDGINFIRILLARGGFRLATVLRGLQLPLPGRLLRIPHPPQRCGKRECGTMAPASPPRCRQNVHAVSRWANAVP